MSTTRHRNQIVAIDQPRTPCRKSRCEFSRSSRSSQLPNACIFPWVVAFSAENRSPFSGKWSSVAFRPSWIPSRIDPCRFRKPSPFDSRSPANQNMIGRMIAIGLLFVRMLCDCFKSRRRLEAEILVLSCSSASHGECICVGPTEPCSSGSIVATLASLTP
jgi:hypothetical protein